MKAMKIMTKTAAVIAGLLLTQQALASNNKQIASECRTIARHLIHLSDQKKQDRCAGDVDIAAAYMDAASIKLDKDIPMDAISSLISAQTELENLSYKSYCGYFANIVKPDIAEIIRLRAEIDIYLRMQNGKH